MRIGKHIKAITAAILILGSTFAQAGSLCEEKGLVLGAVSYHFWDREEKDYNETNETIGFYCDDWTFARFNNSYYEEAWMFSKNILDLNFSTLTPKFEVGAAFGYDELRVNQQQGMIFIYSLKFYKPITERLNTVLRMSHTTAVLSFEYRL